MCFRLALKPNRKKTETQLVAILDRPKPDRLLAVDYNLAELKVLSFDIGVEWEELPQGPKSQMIVELIQHVRRRGKFAMLVEVVNRDQDNILSAFSDSNDA